MTLVVQVGVWRTREQVGERNGGDGGGGHGEQGMVGCGKPINRRGKVEGRVVDDVVLDMGCACTTVCQDLVPKERLVAEATVRLR